MQQCKKHCLSVTAHIGRMAIYILSLRHSAVFMKKAIQYSLLIAIVFTITSCTLETRVSRADKRYMKRAPYDAIIVPGYPYVTAEYPYGTERNKILINVRLYYAKELYDKDIAKNIIFSGAAAHTPFIEGKIMQEMAIALGIPAEHTFAEVKAEHSNQNAMYGRRLAKQLGFKKIAVATDPFQFSYLSQLMHIFTPGLPILSFHPDEMVKYIKPLPSVDSSSAYVHDFVPVE